MQPEPAPDQYQQNAPLALTSAYRELHCSIGPCLTAPCTSSTQILVLASRGLLTKIG